MKWMSLALLFCLFSFHKPSAALEASFSCQINGTPFSSTGSDGMANTAFKTANGVISLALASMDPKYQGQIPPQFHLTVPSSGTCQFNSGRVGATYSAKYSPANYVDAYNAESGSATINSISASRITGTFSGIFSGMGKTFKVTEGKFDLPVSKYSKPLL